MKNLTMALLAVTTIALCSFAYMNVNSETNKVKPKVYKKFLSNFDQVNFPFTVGDKQPSTFAELEELEYQISPDDKYLGSEFDAIIPEMQNGRYSRMGPDDFAAEVMLASTKKFDAIIYSRMPSFRGGKTYYVATFDKAGKMISKVNVARTGYGQFEEARVTKDLSIEIDSYTIESDELQEGDTEIAYHLKETREIFIAPSGNIIEDKLNKEVPTIQKIIPSLDLGMLD